MPQPLRLADPLHLLVAQVAALILSLAVALPAVAEERPVHAPDGLAIGGYDAVAYFSEGRAVPGQRTHAVKWRGAIWLFSAPETLAAFEMNPRAYAPRFGGYCAYALSEGRLAAGDPLAFAIRDGRLYLAHSPRYLALWSADPAGRIGLAEGYWPAILGR